MVSWAKRIPYAVIASNVERWTVVWMTERCCALGILQKHSFFTTILRKYSNNTNILFTLPTCFSWSSGFSRRNKSRCQHFWASTPKNFANAMFWISKTCCVEDFPQRNSWSPSSRKFGMSWFEKNIANHGISWKIFCVGHHRVDTTFWILEPKTSTSRSLGHLHFVLLNVYHTQCQPFSSRVPANSTNTSLWMFQVCSAWRRSTIRQPLSSFEPTKSATYVSDVRKFLRSLLQTEILVKWQQCKTTICSPYHRFFCRLCHTNLCFQVEIEIKIQRSLRWNTSEFMKESMFPILETCSRFRNTTTAKKNKNMNLFGKIELFAGIVLQLRLVQAPILFNCPAKLDSHVVIAAISIDQISAFATTTSTNRIIFDDGYALCSQFFQHAEVKPTICSHTQPFSFLNNPTELWFVISGW